MRNVLQIIMTSVAARTMRATVSARPGYGASSCLRNSHSHVNGFGSSDMPCARVPTSTSSNHDNRRLAHSKQVLGRVFHTHANRVASGQVHPVQGSLHIGKGFSQTAHHVCIGSHPEADAVYHARETDIWFGHHIDLGAHSGSDVL